jgi:hypothetical protein
MMLFRSLFLVLVLALLAVPVLQTAHAVTHFAHMDTVDIATSDHSQDDDGADTDRICLDCLALTAFSAALPFLTFLFVTKILRQQLSLLNHRPILRDFSTPYLTRAPPL